MSATGEELAKADKTYDILLYVVVIPEKIKSAIIFLHEQLHMPSRPAFHFC